MANDYYNASGAPSPGSAGSSAVIRSEYNAIVAAFDKLPTLTGNAGKIVVVNAGANALTTSSAVTINASGQLVVGAGTVALPSIAPTGDLDTGPWFPAANTIAWSVNAVEGMRLNTLGFGIGIASAGSKLQVLKNSVFNTESSAGLYIASQFSAGGAGLQLGADQAANYAYIQSIEPATSYTSKTLVLNPNGGSVGIGRNPGVFFDVYGNAVSSVMRIASNTASTFFRITDNTADRGYIGSGNNVLGAMAQADFGIVAAAGGELWFGSANAARGRVGTTGSWSILAPSSGIPLTINGSGEMARLTTTTARGGGLNYLQFVDPSGAKGYVGYGGSDDTLHMVQGLNANMLFYTNGILRETLLAAGGRVIAAPTSGVPLTVNTLAAGGLAARFTSGSTTSSYVSWTNSNGDYLYIGSGGGLSVGGTNDTVLRNDLAGIYLSAGTGGQFRITSGGQAEYTGGSGSTYKEIGFRGAPTASVTTGAFAATDRGRCVYATAGVTIPNSTMTAEDVVLIQNTTGSSITITKTITTAYNTNTGSAFGATFTLAARGRCAIVFTSATECYVSGNVT